MMAKRIENLEQLRAEILLLKQQRAEQELYFAEKKESIKEAFKSPFTFIKKVGLFFGISKNAKSSGVSADWATALARFVIPFMLNKTLLRGKGAMIKSLFALISQKAINPAIFNQSKVLGVADKVSEWIGSLVAKTKRKKRIDYGIPPDSETY